MPELAQHREQPSQTSTISCAPPHRPTIFWLQGITLTWMLAECGLSLYAAASAHSPVLLAFGSDSLVELLSATVVLLPLLPGVAVSERLTTRAASILLYTLAGVVCIIAALSLALRHHPEVSFLGMAVTVAALIAMPILAWLKRREARRTGNTALAADAVQSATCAYLAAITLTGLTVNALFHVAWFDALAALAAVPLLLKEAREAWKGHTCACH
jgi:Cation efflux family